MVRSATQVDGARCSTPRRSCESSRAPAPASTTSTSPPPAPAASSSSTRPGANSISVAEHALALMLALARLVPAADRAMKDGRWEKKRFLGNELRGKTLGVAGLGRIGQEVAQRARSFGMRIVAHDPYISAEIAVDAGRRAADARRSCARPPTTSRLHLPLTPETRHRVQRRPVRHVQAGPAARQHGARRAHRRGGAARAIESGIVEGAGLDVFEHEPPEGLGAGASCRRSSRRRTSPPRPKRRRNSSAPIPPRPSATSFGPVSSGTPSTSRRFRPRNCSGCNRGSVSPISWAVWRRRWARPASRRWSSATTAH